MSIRYLTDGVPTKRVAVAAIVSVSFVYALFTGKVLAWTFGVGEIAVISSLVILIYKLQGEDIGNHD